MYVKIVLPLTDPVLEKYKFKSTWLSFFFFMTFQSTLVIIWKLIWNLNWNSLAIRKLVTSLVFTIRMSFLMLFAKCAYLFNRRIRSSYYEVIAKTHALLNSVLLFYNCFNFEMSRALLNLIKNCYLVNVLIMWRFEELCQNLLASVAWKS